MSATGADELIRDVETQKLEVCSVFFFFVLVSDKNIEVRLGLAVVIDHFIATCSSSGCLCLISS